MKYKHKCKNCNKIFFAYKIDKKMCSRFCISSYGGKHGVKICKQNKVGSFYNKKIHDKVCINGGKAGVIACKQMKRGAFFNPKLRHQSSINGIMSSTKNKHLNAWYNISFHSKIEMQCAKLLLTRPQFGINCQINIGSKYIDFYPQQYDKKLQGIFIEIHPCNTLFEKRNSISYYNERRKILDDNGFKSKKLIIIQSLKELEKY